MLELLGVTKTYGEGAAEVHALRGVDLAVAPGELVAIMGPSGSGKSSLLTIAGSLEDPTSGDVVIGGVSLSGMHRNDKARLRRRSIGFVFQDFNLLAGLTAAENVAMPLELDGMAARPARALAMHALADLDMTELAAQFPDELSGGERQRVAIARALVNDPVVLLADEPTGNLDTRTGEEILALVRAVTRDTGTTAVMVTHDPSAAAVADRTVHLADGRIAEQEPDADRLSERLMWGLNEGLPVSE
jgi:putative ABC transport system ATP-binding protein